MGHLVNGRYSARRAEHPVVRSLSTAFTLARWSLALTLILTIAGIAIGRASTASAQVAAIIRADVVVCVDPSRAGQTDYVLEESVSNPVASCRPALAGEFVIDLYESDTPIEDPGVRVASQFTNSDGGVIFGYGLAEPWIYVGQGTPGAGGKFSTDVPVASGEELRFLVINYVATDLDAPTIPDAPVAPAAPIGTDFVIDAQVVRCVAPDRSGEVVFLDNVILDTSLPEFAGCVPAVEGGATLDFYFSDTPVEDPGVLAATVVTDSDGVARFTLPPREPFGYLGLGQRYSTDFTLQGGVLSVVVIQYVNALETVINARVLECPNSALVGEIAFVRDADADGSELGRCVGAATGAYSVALYDSPTMIEDEGRLIVDVANVGGGYAGFTYSGGLPVIYVGVSGASGSAFSANIPATTGEELTITAVVYVADPLGETPTVLTPVADAPLSDAGADSVVADALAEPVPVETVSDSVVETAPVTVAEPIRPETHTVAQTALPTTATGTGSETGVVNVLPNTGMGASFTRGSSSLGWIAMLAGFALVAGVTFLGRREGISR